MRRILNVRVLSEPIPFEMGLQVPCGVRAQGPTESHLWADTSAIGTDFSCTGAAEGMPDSRRAPHAGPCAYVHRYSTQTPGGFRHRVSQREECDRDCPAARQGKELLGRGFLVSALCCMHQRIWTGTGPPIHPRAAKRGWNRRTVLS